MVEYPTAVLQPPEKTDTPFREASVGPLWALHGLSADQIERGEWISTFCSHRECSELSGVSERALLVLQTAGFIHSTKASLEGGSYRRVWHLAEAAVATALECLKRAANIDYETTAKIGFHAAQAIRLLFVDFVRMRNADCSDLFRADLVLSRNQNLYLQVSPALAESPHLRPLVVGGTDLIPISFLIEGNSHLIDMRQRNKMAEAFKNDRFRVAVVLGNVFKQFEDQARAMRPG